MKKNTEMQDYFSNLPKKSKKKLQIENLFRSVMNMIGNGLSHLHDGFPDIREIDEYPVFNKSFRLF